MAGKKPGPAKGKGGRPRKALGKGKTRDDGYRRTTVGPKGDGKQVYEHRAKAGLGKTKGSKGKGTVVDHKDGDRDNNAKSNLKRTTKKGNAANRKKK